jgi:aminopeptidase
MQARPDAGLPGAPDDGRRTETMADPRMAKWAEAMTGYSVEVGLGQVVAILGDVAATPLLLELQRAVLERGAHPVLLPMLPGASTVQFEHASDEQLEYVSPVERFWRVEADRSIVVMAESNTRDLAEIDPARHSVRQRARRELYDLADERTAAGQIDWTLTLFPTDAYAQDAEMSSHAYTEFVMAACKLDRADPIQAWREQSAEQQRLIDWLAGRKEVHISAPEVDLTISFEGRTWLNADGRRNFPDGEVFTGPVETSASGTIRFSYPAVEAGREVDGIRLRFADGKVVDASAEKNEAFLIEQLDVDEGARHLGELAFGTNFDIQRFTKNTLFDEKIGGTVHMAVGAGYPETGSVNRSSVHWDMIVDLRHGGQVKVDGEPFLRDGRFLV